MMSYCEYLDYVPRLHPDGLELGSRSGGKTSVLSHGIARRAVERRSRTGLSGPPRRAGTAESNGRSLVNNKGSVGIDTLSIGRVSMRGHGITSETINVKGVQIAHIRPCARHHTGCFRALPGSRSSVVFGLATVACCTFADRTRLSMSTGYDDRRQRQRPGALGYTRLIRERFSEGVGHVLAVNVVYRRRSKHRNRSQ